MGRLAVAEEGLVAGAAMASFVLGMVAATAVTQHAIATQTNLKSKHHDQVLF